VNLDKFKGCILGLAVGDALGMPFETMTSEEIEKYLGKNLKSFHTPSINPHTFSENEKLEAGQWTDDTQLTLATMDALIETCGIFNMDVIAKKHVEVYEKRRGWGKATRKSIERLRSGVHWSKSGEPNGSGNGVMMKIAPLALVTVFFIKKNTHHFPDSSLLRIFADLMDFARMTHKIDSAIVAGALHNFALMYLISRDDKMLFNPNEFLEGLYECCDFLESFLGGYPKVSNQLKKLTNGLFIVEQLSNHELSDQFGGGTKEAFSAYNTFGISYALFLQNPNSFDPVFKAVLCGGDTDSYAAIVGSMLGALHGESIIPEYLLRGLEAREEIEKKVEGFYEICLRK